MYNSLTGSLEPTLTGCAPHSLLCVTRTASRSTLANAIFCCLPLSDRGRTTTLALMVVCTRAPPSAHQICELHARALLGLTSVFVTSKTSTSTSIPVGVAVQIHGNDGMKS